MSDYPPPPPSGPPPPPPPSGPQPWGQPGPQPWGQPARQWAPPGQQQWVPPGQGWPDPRMQPGGWGHFGGFWARFAAWLIDAIILIPFGIVSVVELRTGP